jgi:amino acid adenylation domain-containing protein
MLFIKKFVDLSLAFPEVPAAVDVSSKLSYGELYDQAQRLAEVVALTSSGSMIGVLMEKSIDYIVSILAIHLLGRTVVPLDRSYPVERLQQMITSIDLSLCLLNEQENVELTAMLDKQTRSLRIDELTASSVGAGSVELTAELLDEVPAYVVFTSGTTGQPKPVMVPYRSLSTLIDWMVKVPGQAGTTLMYAAQGFDVSFQEIYSALCHGDRLLVITDEQKKDLHELTRKMVSAAVTRLFLPTSMLIPFVTFNLHDSQVLADLQEVICAGEQLKISPVVRQWFKAHPQCLLINHYGPSETHVVMVHRLDGEPEDWPDLPPIGQVTQASTAYLLDDELQPVVPGTPGQLYIAGRSLALGYYGMSALTAVKFVMHPQTHERMYSTGDICVLNEQALFEFKGRRDRQYKVRGFRVELKEIETVVANSQLVDDCLVVARLSGRATTLVLYFTAQGRDQDLSMSLHTHLAARLGASHGAAPEATAEPGEGNR